MSDFLAPVALALKLLRVRRALAFGTFALALALALAFRTALTAWLLLARPGSIGSRVIFGVC